MVVVCAIQMQGGNGADRFQQENEMTTSNTRRDLVVALRAAIGEAANVQRWSTDPYEFRKALFQWVPNAQIGGWVFDYYVRWSSNIPKLLDILGAQERDTHTDELTTLLRLIQVATVKVECGEYGSVDLHGMGFRISGEQVWEVSAIHGRLVDVFSKLKRNTSKVKRVVMIIEALQAEADALGFSGCIPRSIRKGQDLSEVLAVHKCRLACEHIEEGAQKIRGLVEKFSNPEHTAELLQATDFLIEKGRELMW